MTILFLLFACAPSTGSTSNDTFTDTETDADTTDTVDLKGDYHTCEQALVGLGYSPWEYTGPEDQKESITVDVDADVFVRPWMVAQWEDSNVPAGFQISCSDTNSAPVLPQQEDYLVCSFQADLDPLSDADCTQGLLDHAGQHAIDYFDDEGDGLFVKEE